MNQYLLCFIFDVRKSPSLSVTCVHEKSFIDRKIAMSDMKRQLSLHFELLFTVTCLKRLTEDP